MLPSASKIDLTPLRFWAVLQEPLFMTLRCHSHIANLGNAQKLTFTVLLNFSMISILTLKSVRKLLRRYDGKTRHVIWELNFAQESRNCLVVRRRFPLFRIFFFYIVFDDLFLNWVRVYNNNNNNNNSNNNNNFLFTIIFIILFF